MKGKKTTSKTSRPTSMNQGVIRAVPATIQVAHRLPVTRPARIPRANDMANAIVTLRRRAVTMLGPNTLKTIASAYSFTGLPVAVLSQL